ncbi:hypothetical protein ACFQAS_15645 [Halopenitus salinus]|uniref:Uncharacterized protein n=1 Tax=Halopenitus salinus TaxID=1198295 RepID=A0ABD5UT78_9EURY
MHEYDTNDGRIDRDHYEESPSTGAEETARINHARDGYDHTPTCETCDREGEPIVICDPEHVRKVSVRCSVHAKDFLEVSV